MPIAVNPISTGFQSLPVASISANVDRENVGAAAGAIATETLGNPLVGEAATSDKAIAIASDADSIFGALSVGVLPAQQEQVGGNSPVDAQDSNASQFAQSVQAPSSTDTLSAEQWLQQMLDQQQVQLQARDAAPTDVNIVSRRDADSEKMSNEQQDTAVGPSGIADTAPNQLEVVVAPQVVPIINNSVPAQVLAQVDNRSGEFNIGDSSISAVNNSGKFSVNTDKGAFSEVAEKSKAINDSTDKTAVENHSVSNQVTQTTTPATIPVATQISTQASNQLAGVQSNTAPTDASINQSHLESSLKLQSPEAKWGEQLLHALRDKVHVQLQQSMQSATIRLDPPELGSLEIFLSHESGRLTVQISASQADVARLLQNTSDRLRQDLAGSQFSEVNVQTSSDNQAGQQRSRQDARPLFAEEPVLAASPQPNADKQRAKKDGSGNLLVSV